MSEIKNLCEAIDNLKNSIVLYLDNPIDEPLETDDQLYIWRSRGDKKVRDSHASNNGKIFSYNTPPETGHPGQDFGCRCWAEPYGKNKYVDQKLISKINDSWFKWTDISYVSYYLGGFGGIVSLEETGRLSDIIDYFNKKAIASDGTIGGYKKVERDIINEAFNVGQGALSYDFKNVFEFADFWDLVFLNGRFTLWHSTVKGMLVDGYVRQENIEGREYMVITGVMDYELTDKFTDPFSKVEQLVEISDITRIEAEELVGGDADMLGVPYDIKGKWRTMINITIRVD
jgi:hypothetical protein